MIIVEGPDGAGKSTLIKEIFLAFGTEVLEEYHRGPRSGMGTDPNQRYYVYKALSHEVGGAGEDVVYVYDRLYFSELVYGPLWRGEVVFTKPEQSFIEDLMWALKAPVIFCLPPLKTCFNNVANPLTNQMEKVEETLPDVYKAYSRMPDRLDQGSCLTYDYTKDSLHKVFHYIDDFLRGRRYRTW